MIVSQSRMIVWTFAALATAVVLGVPAPSSAHPHVFVEARAEIVYDGDGNVTAIRHVWRFDDAFTAFALQGLDTNGDGTYSREELAELAEVNITSLKDFAYFTFGDDTKIEIDFNPPKDYWLDVATVAIGDYWAMSAEDLKAIAEDAEKDRSKPIEQVKLLQLHFTLPLKQTVGSAMPVTFDVYDPTYYVDFRFAKQKNAITLANGPENCRIETRGPKPLDAETAAQLAAIGPEVRELPPELREVTQSLVNQMVIACGAAVAAAAPTAPVSPVDAVARMAKGGAPKPLSDAGRTGENAAKAGETADAKESTTPAPSTGLFSGIVDRIAQLQSDFYQRLVGALRRFKTDRNAVWFLFLLSFAYGVFHAAGPGHGKAIITSYMFANEATVRRGIVLSFAAAFVQASVAVGIVTIVALALRGTSIAMKTTLGAFEAGSYALVALLGGWLVFVKLRGFLRVADGQASHDHMHDHDSDLDDGHDGTHCGHSHAPDAGLASRQLSLRESAAAVFSIGMRPCSGALVVLVFALSQGLFMAGVASAYVMAVGTALTIATLAVIAVTSKALAVRIVGAETARGRRIVAGLEVAAAFAVLAVGMLLLVAALRSPTTL